MSGALSREYLRVSKEVGGFPEPSDAGSCGVKRDDRGARLRKTGVELSREPEALAMGRKRLRHERW